MKTKITFIAFVALLCTSTLSAGEWFVAPNGNDSQAGTRDKPFATVQKAQQAVREAKKNDDKGPWTVRFAAGEYDLVEPIRFTPEDSGTDENSVLYVGEAGKTVFSGGIDIPNWKVEDGNWVAELPKINGRNLFFEQLFMNGKRLTRARYPNTGFLVPQEVKQGIPINEQNPSKQFTEQQIVAKSGELELLKGLTPDELKFGQLIVHHHWDTTRRILLQYESDANLLTTQGSPMKHWNPWRNTSLYYIENVKPAFDEPGEWFYDGNAGKVYYKPLPGEKPESCRFIVPKSGVNKLLVIAGDLRNDKRVANIRFENIVFAYTDSSRRADVMKRASLDTKITGDLDFPGPSQYDPAQAAAWTEAVVSVDAATKIEFVDCEIKHTGEYGIWFKDSDYCKVERSYFADLGAGAVRIGNTGGIPNINGKRILTTNNVVDNCIIKQGGRVHACAVAVLVGNGTEDNRITHNDIGDFYYTGISAGWVWGYQGGIAHRNIIEFNRIHDLGQGALADMGGVYTLGTSLGTRVCNNVIFNVESYAYGGWGLYTDEGSEGILMENNLVYNTSDGSFHQHYGKHNTIRNNILAFSRPHQLAATRIENHLSFTFENNIIYWKGEKAIGYRADQVRADWGSNLWWKTDGNVDFNGKTHADWLAIGKDIGGIVEDPKFVDPDNYDFRLQEGSPAGKIEFKPFDYAKAGVYGDAEWVNRR